MNTDVASYLLGSGIRLAGQIRAISEGSEESGVPALVPPRLSPWGMSELKCRREVARAVRAWLEINE